MEQWLLGMTTAEEQKYFEEYARGIYSGQGEIVDLGCWLGSTTIPLASGLSQNANSKGHRVHAYDLFRWEDYMSDCIRGTDLEGRYQQGDSFLDEFARRTESWRSLIEIHPGNLEEMTWNGRPIELLLVDAMKSWKVANAIIRNFFPALIPQKSYVIEQDYAHYYTSWIHLIHYKMRNHFEVVCPIPNSYAFVFRYTDPIPIELLEAQYEASSFANAEVEAAFRYSMEMTTNPQTRANIASAKVMWYLHLNDPETANRCLHEYLLQGLPQSGDLQIVSDLLRRFAREEV